ncbi:MAG: hypothetical protein AB1806_21445 [Acidobacteriota bacterium]
MIRVIVHAVGLSLFGALAGAVGLILVSSADPVVVFEMDRDLSLAKGLYPAERSGDFTFAWTTERASFNLTGISRRQPWTCSVRFRGARPDPAVPQPDVLVTADGRLEARVHASNELREVELSVPARPGHNGVTLTVWTQPTFVPSASDPRALGVQLDRLSCRPATSGFVSPPARALGYSALSLAILAAGFALLGLSPWLGAGLNVVVAAGLACTVAAGTGPFSPFVGGLVPVAAWSTLAAVALVAGARRITRRHLSAEARLAVAASLAFLYLKLAALLHPDKAIVDALFHAHRLEWVLAGRFYFTQLSTSATPFPYAVGLYVFAAPWSWLTRDHVALLRVVVCASEALAGLLLYVMVSRTGGNRLAGIFAIVLYGLLPLPFTILGNANLTNAFGAAVSLATVGVIVVWGDRLMRPLLLAGLVLLSLLGFVSHISTFVLLSTLMLTMAGLFGARGDSALRGAASATVLAALLGMVLAVGLYWGHFGDVYRQQLSRAREAVIAPAPPGGDLARSLEARDAAAPGLALGRRTLTLRERVTDAVGQAVDRAGWPALALALIGVWRLRQTGVRDRLALTLIAWGLTCLGWMTLAVLGPGNMRYQQDAWEFISRVHAATLPAIAILAGLGAAWCWRGGVLLRFGLGGALVWALTAGADAWGAWLR